MVEIQWLEVVGGSKPESEIQHTADRGFALSCYVGLTAAPLT